MSPPAAMPPFQESAPGRSADFSPLQRPDAPPLRAEARAPERRRPLRFIAREQFPPKPAPHSYPHRRRGRGSSAFTLLEVMLAIGILMMVLSVIYSTWMAVLRAKLAADKAALSAQRSRISVRAIQSALEGVQVFQQNQGYYAFLADTSGQFAYLSVASRLPESFPGSGLFGDQTLRRVTFEVENGTNGLPELVMRQYPLLLATNATDEAYPIVLANDVTDFLLEFWDDRQGEWAPEWLYTNQLPAVVRFLVGVGQRADDPANPQSVQVQTVALTASLVPAQLQGPPRPRLNPGANVDTNQPPADPNNAAPQSPGEGGLQLAPGRLQ